MNTLLSLSFYKLHDLTQIHTDTTRCLVVLETQIHKCEYNPSPSETLYYTKTSVKLRKTGASPPVYRYFTVHMDIGDQGGYPGKLSDSVYLVAYGVSGHQNVVDSGVYDAHNAFEITTAEVSMLTPLNMNCEQILDTPSLKPQIFVLTGKYLKTLDNKYEDFGRTSVVIAPAKCKMTKCYFYDLVLGFRYNLFFVVDSVDPKTQHSRTYSYVENKSAFQVLNPNLFFFCLKCNENIAKK